VLIVVRLVLVQDPPPPQVGLVPDEGARSRNSRRHPPIQRSVIGFMQGVWMLHSTIRMPASPRTVSNVEVKFEPRSRIMNLTRACGVPEVSCSDDERQQQGIMIIRVPAHVNISTDLAVS